MLFLSLFYCMPIEFKYDKKIKALVPSVKPIDKQAIKRELREKKKEACLVEFTFKAFDRVGLLHEIAKVFAHSNIAIIAASMSTSKQIATNSFLVEIEHPEKLEKLEQKFKKIPRLIEVRTSFVG